MISIIPNKECVELPAKVNSFGLWAKMENSEKAKDIWQYSLPILEMFMIFIFITWQAIYYICKSARMSRFTSQIAGGVLLSLVFFHSNEKFQNIFFPQDYRKNVIGTMGSFGYTMYWFLMGVKMDWGIMFGTKGKAAVLGISSVLGPVIVSQLSFPSEFNKFFTSLDESVFILFIQSLSAFPVIISLINDLGMQNSELGRLGMSSAFVSDMVGLQLSLIFNCIKLGISNAQNGWIDLAAMAAFLLFAVFIWRPAMFWIIGRTPEGRPVRKIYIYVILAAVFASGVYWAMFEQFLPFGPYILGLALPAGPPLGSALIDKFDCFINGVWLPFFITSSSMNVDMKLARNFRRLNLILVAFAAKFFTCLMSCIAFRMPWKDAAALSLIMNYKGTVELASYAFTHDLNIVKKDSFTTIILFFMVTSYILPILVQFLYDPSRKYAGYQKRDMLHLKPNSELRILACIHRLDNIIPIINLLEASYPTKESPLDVNILHLIELSGQATPLFISHQMQSKSVGARSYSENVIISFNSFRSNYWDSVNVNLFTSVSAPEHMYEDTCMLALDKLTSLIILPFHRTWSLDGSAVISESNTIRTLNCSVLGRAPCSVAILVDRKRLGRRSLEESSFRSCKMCMVFFGGKDDREALVLARRMAKDSRIEMTVLRFCSSMEGSANINDWNSMLDSTELRDMRQNKIESNNIRYMEETVKDGIEVASMLRSLVDEFEFFIVGKSDDMKSCFKLGLEEWREFPELGVIGDLLASPDLDTKASVLVVQHQKQMT